MTTESQPTAISKDKLPGNNLIMPGTTIGGEVGTFYVDFTLWNNDRTRSHTLNGLVDTGAFYPQVPAFILEDLGIEPEYSEPFKLADGSRLELPVGYVAMELEGETRLVHTIFGPPGSSVLLGAFALEAFALAVDAKRQRFIKADLPL